jgi:hypothetical protein
MRTSWRTGSIRRFEEKRSKLSILQRNRLVGIARNTLIQGIYAGRLGPSKIARFGAARHKPNPTTSGLRDKRLPRSLKGALSFFWAFPRTTNSYTRC